MRVAHILSALGATAALGGCGPDGTADSLGVIPQPEHSPARVTSPFAGNGPGPDWRVDPGVAPLDSLP